MDEIIIEIDGLQLPSWNKIYSNPVWGVRKTIADKVHRAMEFHLEEMDLSVIDGIVDIKIECYYKDNRRPDSDNVCDKLVIDSICGVVIKDDDWRHVRYTTTASLLDRVNPRTVITITRVDGT